MKDRSSSESSAVSAEQEPECRDSYDFLFLFDKATGSPRVYYFMINPRRPSQIFPKMNVINMKAIKGLCGFSVVVLENKLYIMGGKDWETGKHVAAVNRFDPLTNTWDKMAPMKYPRCRFSAEAVNGQIYVIGGETTKGRITDSVERYDPEGDTWVDVTALPRPRADHASCSLGGKLYVSGGTSNVKQQSTNIFWVYDAGRGEWGEVTEEGMTMPKERERHNMVAVGDAKIFVLGGRGLDYMTYLEKDEGSVCHFNLLDQSPSRRLPAWDLSHPAIPHPRSCAGVAALDKNIWVFGGTCLSGPGHVTRVDVYDSHRRRWRETFSLPGGHCSNVDMCRLSVPTSNTSFSFMDNYLCSKWVFW